MHAEVLDAEREEPFLKRKRRWERSMKLVLNIAWGCGLGLFGSVYGPVADCRVHVNEPYGTNAWEFLRRLQEYYLLTKISMALVRRVRIHSCNNFNGNRSSS
jgi:hypothetical protein